MEPMSTYVKGPGRISGTGFIAKYDFDDASTQKLSWSVQPCRKFDDSQTADYNAGKSFRDLHVITLPEMFFVAAEAYYKLNDPKALERLNVVRERAGLTAENNIDFGHHIERVGLRNVWKRLSSYGPSSYR